MQRECREEREQQQQHDRNRNTNKYGQQKGKKQQAHYSDHHKDEESSSDTDGECHSGFVAVNKALSTTPAGIKKKTWLVDSGSSKHMCNEKRSFATLEKLKNPEKVEVGDGHIVMTEYKGTVIMNMKIKDKVRKV